MKIDVEKVKKCVESYRLACQLIREIEEKVEELFHKNGDEISHWGGAFLPILAAQKGELMRWLGKHGVVIIDEKGNMTYLPTEMMR